MGCSNSSASSVAYDPSLPSLNPLRNLFPQDICHHDRPLSEDFELLAQLGSGMSGEVRLARHRVTGSRVAVKSQKFNGICSRELLSAAAEVRVACAMEHPRIARLQSVYVSNAQVDMVLEFVEGGDLFDRMKAQPGKAFAEGEAARVVRDMLVAILHVHEKGYAHCDVKLENFLCERDGHVKLCDFGLSQWDDDLRRCAGTVYYIAPEVIRGRYDKRCDLWALGVACYMLLSGKMPFSGETSQCKQRILEGKYAFHEKYWGHVSESAKDFVRRFLVVDPNARMTLAEALEHPWLAHTDPWLAHTELSGALASFDAAKLEQPDCEATTASSPTSSRRLPSVDSSVEAMA